MITTTFTGIVLTAMPIGEYDKRLVILTRERGKITAFAKGARKMGSAFLACSQPFSFGEFTVYEGRTSYSVMSVEISNYFKELRENMEACYYGLYFLELSDYFTRENEDATLILKLLYQSLRALTLERIPPSLIRRIVELKMFEYNGWAPQVFSCVKCNNEDGLMYFNSLAGGVICGNCSNYAGKHSNVGSHISSMSDYQSGSERAAQGIMISGTTIYTMQYILSSPVEKLYTFKLSDEVSKELNQCVENYRKTYIDKKLKSLELLEKLF